MLRLVYNSPVKVDTREDWQKIGRYRWCRAVRDIETGQCFVEYCEWGSNRSQLIECSNHPEALLLARTMNVKE